MSVVIGLSSCSDPCDDVNCGPGVCEDGTCLCPDGFSGINCEIEDLCFSVDCGDFGTCEDGLCNCERGYVGELCETAIRDKFIGNWIINDWTCQMGTDTDVFQFNIIEGPDILEVIFTDVENPDLELISQVEGDIFSFSTEIDLDGINVGVGGQGELIGEELNFELIFEAFGITEVCSGVAVRN